MRLTRMSIVVFHVFIRFGYSVLYPKWVITPVHLLEAQSNMREFDFAGFPGCVHQNSNHVPYYLFIMIIHLGNMYYGVTDTFLT